MAKGIFSKFFSNDSSRIIARIEQTKIEIENIRLLAAKSIISSNRLLNSACIQDYEFKVFSQWGDDGIIQYLINTIEIPNKTFIEFGVQDYSESNTRFLLMNNNWSGLIMDGSIRSIESIKRSSYYWKYDLRAKMAFITTENINSLIEIESFDKNLGIYHIDIDGNDYWVWKATTVVTPIIVIVEYQSLFGCERAITVPYKPDFQRTLAHSSNLFYGSSLLALCDLAEEKGYYFVGCNSAGNNAYFVRKDKIGQLKPLSAKEGYVLSRFRESRDENGALTYLREDARQSLIGGMEVFNTRLGKLESF